MTKGFDIKHAFSLEGQRALVTGGAGGIGQAIAVAMAGAGADVAISVHKSPGDKTLAAIRNTGRKAHGLNCDLARLDEKSAQKIMDDLVLQFGDIDILVNNAGIIRRADAVDHSGSDWREVMATNLDALWYLSQAAGKKMCDRGNGRIINIASLLSFQGGIRVPAYAAAKHAVAGLTKALANEWAAQGVNVNAIAPGYIVTDNTKALREDQERFSQIVARIPAGRWGTPDNIAGAAVFLASSAADYVHGAVLSVDGGWMGR
ncbi:2-dehydro-3-deoxy-D-gluconate 5-dehydrogenase @ 2-deoxy-D-gluconate 3-dehydrogenase [hydrothermal vent metagenome]|uniref:2-dehydro-3-deoxy-D-gluconate 5-dehydrogenase @ 2-deoxy-D-gluconate 3-dehydrogenase n=1 Tax=hydrothermal vent metagenome TaxID=652676 RepID=A0A3B0T819_9ZZZZ